MGPFHDSWIVNGIPVLVTLQGLFDLMFGAYLVRYIPEEKATSGFRARLESMSQFGEKYAQRVEDRAKAREEKASEKQSESEEENNDAEDEQADD